MCTRIFKSYKIGKSALSTIVLERYNELAIRILQAPTIIMSLRSSSPNSAIITRNWANCSHLSRICNVSQQTLPIPTLTSRAKSSLDQSREAVLRVLAIALIKRDVFDPLDRDVFNDKYVYLNTVVPLDKVVHRDRDVQATKIANPAKKRNFC